MIEASNMWGSPARIDGELNYDLMVAWIAESHRPDERCFTVSFSKLMWIETFLFSEISEHVYVLNFKHCIYMHI